MYEFKVSRGTCHDVMYIILLEAGINLVNWKRCIIDHDSYIRYGLNYMSPK